MACLGLEFWTFVRLLCFTKFHIHEPNLAENQSESIFILYLKAISDLEADISEDFVSNLSL